MNTTEIVAIIGGIVSLNTVINGFIVMLIKGNTNRLDRLENKLDKHLINHNSKEK